MDNLPKEILRYLLSFLNVESLLSAAKACKYLHKEATSRDAWKWRSDRLGFIDLDDDLSSIKYRIIEKVKVIKAFRRFVENPYGAGSQLIQHVMATTLTKGTGTVFHDFHSLEYYINCAVAEFGSSARSYISEMITGIRQEGALFDEASWYDAIWTAIFQLHNNHVFLDWTQYKISHEHIQIQGVHVAGYSIWKTLCNDWGQIDIRPDPGFWQVKDKKASIGWEDMTLDHILLPFKTERAEF